MTTRRIAAILLAIAAGLTGCAAPHAFVVNGDEKSVQVGYYGDVAIAWPAARQHCAAYGRTARLAFTGDDNAYFDCVAP